MASFRVWARRIGPPVLSVGLCLIVFELGARVLYEAPWYEQLVDEQGSQQEYEYERNEFRLRGPAYAYAKPPGTRRVLMLGDSFTFGMGVAHDEDTFARILEGQLGEAVQLANGGIIGSLTHHWVEVWDIASPVFDPDLVVMVFFLRDGTLAGSIPEFFDDIRDAITMRNRKSRLYQRSYFYRFFRDARDRKQIVSNYTQHFRASYFGDEAQTEEWRNAQRNLLHIRDGALARGAKVAFVVFPILVGLEEADDYPFQDITDLLTDFGREAGMPTLDLLPAFLGRNGPDLWVSALDQHPNEAGHALAAQAMLPFLKQLLEERQP